MSTYVLRIYAAGDDDLLVAEFSTDPARVNPYLIAPSEYSGQEVDLANGAASISEITVSLIDPTTVAGDQTSGFVTGLLADLGGNSAAIGVRFWLGEDRGEGLFPIIDGICGRVRLRDSYAGYDFSVRDMRERERRSRAFLSAAARSADGTVLDAPLVWPRGRILGYGSLPSGGFLLPPSVAAVGTFRVTPFARVISLPSVNKERVPADRIVTAKMRSALARQGDRVPGVSLLWSAGGQNGQVHDPQLPLGAEPPLYYAGTGIYRSETGKHKPASGGAAIDVEYFTHFILRWPSGQPEPPDGATVAVRIAYTGEPTPDYPFRWEGTAGELLAGLYDGDFSRVWSSGAFGPASPPIRYSASAVAAMQMPVRLVRKSPVDDLRAWTEAHVYLGSAPALDENGAIAPVSWALPGAGALLVEFNDTNATPVPGWEQDASDAINAAELTYIREYATAAATDPLNSDSAGDGIAEAEVPPVRMESPESILRLGEQLLKRSPETLRAIGGQNGQPITGDSTQEVGHQMALQLAQHALDRFVLGGQHFFVRAMRTDASVEAAKVGDWAIEATSWKPDYGTRKRGANRLAQIVSRKNVSPAWAEFGLIDAGPANQPLSQPTLGALSQSGGTISVPVTAIPSDGEAAVYYAISTVLPANTSGLWTYADRILAPATITLPAVPAGAVVWVRARSEGPGRRPSAYTNAVSITLPQTPVLTKLTGEIGADGLPYIDWTGNPFVAAVRITYEVHQVGAAGGTLSQVLQSSLTPVGLPVTLDADQQVTVAVEPWSGWNGSTVTGTAGAAQFVAIGAAPATGDEIASRSLYDFKAAHLSDGSVEYTWKSRPAVHSKWGAAALYPLPMQETHWADLLSKLARLKEDRIVLPAAADGFYAIGHVEPRDANLRPGYVWRGLQVGTPPEVRPTITFTESADGTESTVRVELIDPRGVVTGIPVYLTNQGIRSGPFAAASLAPLTWEYTFPLHPDHPVIVDLYGTRNDGKPDFAWGPFSADTNKIPGIPEVTEAPGGLNVDGADTDTATLHYVEDTAGVLGPETLIPARGSDPRYGFFAVSVPAGGTARRFRIYGKNAAGEAGPYRDQWVQPAPADTKYARGVVTVVASDADSTVLQINTVPAGGTVTLTEVSGTAGREAGPTIGTPSADGTQWTFSRGAINTGTGQVKYNIAVAGHQSDTAIYPIEEQGRDTVPLLVKTEAINATSDTVTARFYCGDPYPNNTSPAGDIVVTPSFHGVESVSPATPQTIPAAQVTNSLDTTGYVDFLITLGSTSGQAVFTPVRAGRLSVPEAIDVPPADRTNGVADVLAVHVANDGGTAHATAHFDPDTVIGTAAGRYRLAGGTAVNFDVASDRTGIFSFPRSTSGVLLLEVSGKNENGDWGPWHKREVDRYDPPPPALHYVTLSVEDTGSPGNDNYSVTLHGSSMSGKSAQVEFFRNGSLRHSDDFALASDTENEILWVDGGAGDNTSDQHKVTVQLFDTGANYGPPLTSRTVPSTL